MRLEVFILFLRSTTMSASNNPMLQQKKFSLYEKSILDTIATEEKKERAAAASVLSGSKINYERRRKERGFF